MGLYRLFIMGRLSQPVPEPSATLSRALGDLLSSAVLSHVCVQSGAIQWPAVLPACGLYKGCEIRLWNVQSGKPHHIWFALSDLKNQTKQHFKATAAEQRWPRAHAVTC